MRVNDSFKFKLVVAVGVAGLAGVVGALFTGPAISSGWYAGLAKPALNPPALNYSIWTLNREERRTEIIQLYYYNSELDKDDSGNIACSRKGLVAVTRDVPVTRTPIQDAIKTLLLGNLTAREREQGIDTEYPLEGLSLKGALLKDGVLTLEFNDSKNKTVGGACRVSVLWHQIEATARQFPEVQQVRFLPEEIFQP